MAFKSIKFSNKEIVITFGSDDEALKLGEWANSQLLEEYISVDDCVFTYDISSYNGKFYPLKRLLRKLVYDSDSLSDDLYSSAFSTDLYDYVLDIYAKGDTIFRITPVNSDGTFGTLDFGVHKYSDLFRISKLNRTGEVFFLTGRYHVGDYDNCELQLGGDEDYKCREILIEIGNVQF
jgi:hypothetical protein